MVRELEAHRLLGSSVGPGGVDRARVDQGDAPRIVGHMERFALQALGALAAPEDLEGAEVDPLLDQRGRFLPDFPKPRPAGIIDEISSAAASEIDALQAVALVPVHV